MDIIPSCACFCTFWFCCCCFCCFCLLVTWLWHVCCIWGRWIISCWLSPPSVIIRPPRPVIILLFFPPRVLSKDAAVVPLREYVVGIALFRPRFLNPPPLRFCRRKLMVDGWQCWIRDAFIISTCTCVFFLAVMPKFFELLVMFRRILPLLAYFSNFFENIS